MLSPPFHGSRPMALELAFSFLFARGEKFDSEM